MRQFALEILLYVFIFTIVRIIATMIYTLKNDLYKRKPKKINTHPPTRFVALVACCNEEKGIESSIRSLRAQGKIKEVFVVVNNTTDSTPEILEGLRREYGKWLTVIYMKHNPHRKSGALNCGLELINLKHGHIADDLIVLTLDADTIVGNDTCGKISEIFKINPRAGGTSVQCLLQDLNVISNRKSPSVMQRVWYAFQNIEYTLAMPIKISQKPNTQVLAGACSAFRLCALQDVCEVSTVAWNVKTLVEDYNLSRELYRLGWETPTSDAEAYTDAPVDALALYKQRKRWYKGTIQLLWEDIRKKFVWDDAFKLFCITLSPVYFALMAIMFSFLFAYPELRRILCVPFFISSLVLSAQYALFHKKQHGKSILSWVFTLVPLFYLFYIMWDKLLYTLSIISSIIETERKWE